MSLYGTAQPLRLAWTQNKKSRYKTNIRSLELRQLGWKPRSRQRTIQVSTVYCSSMDNSTKTTAQRFSDLMSTIRPESVLSLVDSENDRHEHIMKEARERVMLESRNGLCKLFEVTYSEIRNDDECGGSVKVQFPNGWTKYSAERFCIQFLKLDLSEYDGGPGRMFRQCSTWVSGETGVVTVAIRCGLDI